jgi:hypothetical protein
MRRLSYFVLASGLFWAGCMGNSGLGTAAIAQTNVENMSRIAFGMSDNQVFRIMRQPFSTEIIDLDGDSYHIWFYITKMTILTQKELVHSNLTPIIFKNRVFQAKGYDYYKSLLRKETAEVTKPPKQDTQDKDLERALTPPPRPKPKPGEVQTPTTAPKTSTVPPPPEKATPTKKPPTPVNQQKNKTTPTQKKSPSTTSTQHNTSMSKKPDQPPPEKPASPVPLTEEDENMIQEEQEENFNFW